MNQAIDREVRRRARDRCEYCLVPQSTSKLKFPIDHVISRQHHGPTELSNLALACGACNRKKGPNIAGLDPATALVTPLFNPCHERWADHFRWDGPAIVGISPVGRATVDLLELNEQFRVAAREALIDEMLLKIDETDRAE
jgi:hypothetical protein